MAKKLTLEWLVGDRTMGAVPAVGLFGLFALPSKVNVTNVRQWVRRMDARSLYWLVWNMISNTQVAAAILAHLNTPMHYTSQSALDAANAICKLPNKRIVKAIIQLAEKSSHLSEEP